MPGCCNCRRARSQREVFPEDQATSVSPKASAENGSAGDQPSVSEDATASGKIDPSSSLTPRAGAQGKPFPKRPMGCKLSQNIWDKLEELFRKMDPDGSNAVSKEEARLFFKGAFGKVSADAMFNEVDVDGSGAIDADEFVSFWIHVRKSGYKEQDILDELDELLEGGAWVDWKDGKDTGAAAGVQFPKRPMLCRLGANTWEKCRELFMKIDPEGKCITQEKAAKHFVKGFGKVSVDAMFNEIDMNHHGQITPKEWMKFWVQVKSNGYKDQDILDELDNLMEGQQWVDWKDGRSTA